MEPQEKTFAKVMGTNLSAATANIIGAFSLLVLAALLTPEHFGIIAAVNLIIMSAGLLRELLLNRSRTLQNEDYTDAAQAVFLADSVGTVLLYGIIFLVAPFLAAFFHKTELTAVIRVLGLTLMITALSDVFSASREREKRSSLKTAAETVQLILYGVLAVVFAYQGYRYWSLVYAALLGRVGHTLMLWYGSPWRVNLRSLKFKPVKSVFKFDGKTFFPSLADFAIRNIDVFFIGWLLGIRVLGFYNLSYRLANFPAAVATGFTAAASSFWGHFRKGLEKGIADHKIYNYTVLLTAPLSVFIIFYLDDFFLAFYDHKWDVGILPLKILVLLGALRSLRSGLGDIFSVLSKPSWPFKISLIQLLLLSILIYPAAKEFGLEGVAALVVLIMLPSLIIEYYFFKQAGRYPLWTLFEPLVVYVLFSITAILVPLALSSTLAPLSLKLQVILKGLASSAVYMILVLLYNRNLVAEIKAMWTTVRA